MALRSDLQLDSLSRRTLGRFQRQQTGDRSKDFGHNLLKILLLVKVYLTADWLQIVATWIRSFMTGPSSR